MYRRGRLPAPSPGRDRITSESPAAGTTPCRWSPSPSDGLLQGGGHAHRREVRATHASFRDTLDRTPLTSQLRHVRGPPVSASVVRSKKGGGPTTVGAGSWLRSPTDLEVDRVDRQVCSFGATHDSRRGARSPSRRRNLQPGACATLPLRLPATARRLLEGSPTPPNFGRARRSSRYPEVRAFPGTSPRSRRSRRC